MVDQLLVNKSRNGEQRVDNFGSKFIDWLVEPKKDLNSEIVFRFGRFFESIFSNDSQAIVLSKCLFFLVYTEDFSQGVMVSCNGFFFLMLSVVKCRQITSTVINYHVGWTISRYVT